MSKNTFIPPKNELLALGVDITFFEYSLTKLLSSCNFAWNRKWKR